VKEEPKVDETTEAEGGEDEDHGNFLGFYDRKVGLPSGKLT